MHLKPINNIIQFILWILSFILGTFFFVCLLIYMLLESALFFIYSKLNTSYLYNFREQELQKLDITNDSKQERLYLGNIPNSINSIELLDVSEILDHTAKDILLEVRLYPDQTSEAFEIEIQIYDEHCNKTIEYVYLFYNLHKNTELNNFLSAKLWFPITSDHKIKVKTNAILCNDIKKISFKGDINLIGWRV